MSKYLYIVGIDDSEWSYRAVERAINLAEQTDAKVKVVYVMQWPVIMPISVGGVDPYVFNRKEEEKRVAESIIKPLIDKYSDAKVTVESELLFGEPVHELSEKVKREHANMLFLGRRGRSVFADVILGSVANRLAHVVGIPIVLVP